MIRRPVWFMVLFALVASGPARADQFEQLDGPWLVKMLRGTELSARKNLGLGDLIAMPALLADSRSSLVLAKTGLGNPVRLLIVAELRKPVDGRGEPIPVVVFERLDTFDSGEPTTRLASRKEIVLFDGFEFDLDTGQVVPSGQGGDLVFRNKAEGGPRIETLGEAKLFLLTKPPVFSDTKIPMPTPGKRVLPGDFAGRYRLFANGQWSGTLDLSVEGRGVVTGQFRSDLHGTTYPVTGQVTTDVAHKILFAIKYPRARQEFEGYLWAEGKGAMAGVASIAERPVGFFAIREGSRFAAEGVELGSLKDVGPIQPGTHILESVGDHLIFDGQPRTTDEWSAVLKREAEDALKSPSVLIRCSDEQKFRDLLKIIEAVQGSGVRTIRFGAVEHTK